MTSKQLGVIGDPIAHSKSPAIHNAAYRVLKLDWSYEANRVAAGQLNNWLAALPDNWHGVSVTAPLKEEAASFAATDLEKTLNSANTSLRTQDGWVSYNTDVFGIVQSLRTSGIAEPKRVAIVGSGATAKSAIAAVGELYPSAKLRIAARRSEAASRLANFARHAFKLDAKPSSNIVGALRSADLVISTLPANQLDEYAKKAARGWLGRPSGVLFDVAYEPWPSTAASLWSKADLPVISGIEMLLWQAIAQIRIFVEGDMRKEVFNEATVIHAMRDSVGLV